jgi:hypothetical protein
MNATSSSINITPYNLAKLLDFLQLLDDQINIDGYGPLSRLIVFSVSALTNRGIVADEIRAVVKIINKIESEKVISIVNDDVYEAIKTEDKSFISSEPDSFVEKIKKDRSLREREKNIYKWVRWNGNKRGITSDNFDDKLIIHIAHPKKFDEFKRKVAKNQESQVHVRLKNEVIAFNKKEQSIRVGERKSQLPPYKNEYYLAKVMFKSPPKIPVEWITIAKEITGKNFNHLDTKKDQRTIKDAMYALNERVQHDIHTSDDLFTWKNKSVIRNY